MITAVEQSDIEGSVDWLGFVRRTEQAVEILGRGYVFDGFILDEAAADRTLRYVKSLATGGPDDDDEQTAAMAFMRDHGVSLDWLLLGNPAVMICAAAAHARVKAILNPRIVGGSDEAH